MASIGSEHASRSRLFWRPSERISERFFWRSPLEALRVLFAGGSDLSVARRLAGTAFLIRVVSALVAFLSQIALARWLGGFQFGIYVYVWTWILLLGGMVDLGLGSAAQRFIPEYTEHKNFALLRGFLRGSRLLATIIATVAAGAAAAIVTALTPHIGPATIVPLYLACAALPICGLSQVQSGIARSYDWVNLGLSPAYVLRQIALLALLGLAFALGAPMGAVTATLIAVVTLWAVTLGQLVVLDRRLSGVVEAGPKAYAVRSWLATSAPIFVVEAFYLLLTYADVIVLQFFRPPNEVGIYYAAAKTMALVAFIYFSVAQTLAHKFAEYHVTGDRKRLADFLAVAVRMTFWPSLGSVVVLLAVGRPLLRMFGGGFVAGYYLMFIIAIGLLARASVGPAERLLNMLGERRSCALIYAGSFALNLVLCLLLIPRMGISGAAWAGAITLVCESASLFFVAKYRLGMHCFIFGGREGR
ncbi:MAG TPA: lipopolysaccharide biosynthesis protein [Xanthobacteraceae bacterium]|nr:lipopolysaccharide biosynthesis protein [Xanthobacteraceae bacterium]